MITNEPIIAEVEPILELPGIVATKTSLTFSDSVTNAQKKQIFGRLAKMEKSVAWYLGDTAISLQEDRRRELEIEADQIRQRADECSKDSEGIRIARDLRARADKLEAMELVRYSSELCEAYNVDRGYLWNCVSLCAVFQPSQRCEGLSVNHHRVILSGLGGVEEFKNKKTKGEALRWLEEAKENKWPAPELRKNICLSRAEFHAPTQALEVNQYQELDDADAWAIQHVNDEIDPREAVPMVTRWQALIEFLSKVQSLAKV